MLREGKNFRITYLEFQQNCEGHGHLSSISLSSLSPLPYLYVSLIVHIVSLSPILSPASHTSSFSLPCFSSWTAIPAIRGRWFCYVPVLVRLRIARGPRRASAWRLQLLPSTSRVFFGNRRSGGQSGASRAAVPKEVRRARGPRRRGRLRPSSAVLRASAPLR